MAKRTKSTEDDLRKDIQKLNEKIVELEDIIIELREPIKKLEETTLGYFKLIDLYMRYGSISPEILFPELKDNISREILKSLFEKNGLNISQITEAVRSKRGTASRRIIRQKLHSLAEKGYVIPKKTRKTVNYYISEEVLKKWSQVLGLF